MGKTSLSVLAKKSLLLSFEKGYNDLVGVKAVDIPKWATFKEVLRELRKPEVQKAYDTMIIDTATIAWEKCEEFICQTNQVNSLADMGYGRGHKACKTEFEKAFREIQMLGYGIIFLAHSEEKKPLGGSEDDLMIAPLLEKRAYTIINGMVDIIAYIDVDHNTGKRYLQTRGTKNIVAGSRFKYMSPRFELSYDNLVNELVSAIEKRGEEAGEMVVNDPTFATPETINVELRPFSAAREEANTLWVSLIEKDPDNKDKILSLVEKTFGQRIKLSEIAPSQQELFELVIEDMRELNK